MDEEHDMLDKAFEFLTSKAHVTEREDLFKQPGAAALWRPWGSRT